MALGNFYKVLETATFSVTTATTAVALTSSDAWDFASSNQTASDRALITTHGAPINIRWDGTSPTTTYNTGHHISTGCDHPFALEGNSNITALRVVVGSSGTGAANVTITLESI